VGLGRAPLPSLYEVRGITRKLKPVYFGHFDRLNNKAILVLSATLKSREWKTREWKLRHQNAWLEIAGEGKVWKANMLKMNL